MGGTVAVVLEARAIDITFYFFHPATSRVDGGGDWDKYHSCVMQAIDHGPCAEPRRVEDGAKEKWSIKPMKTRCSVMT